MYLSSLVPADWVFHPNWIRELLLCALDLDPGTGPDCHLCSCAISCLYSTFLESLGNMFEGTHDGDTIVRLYCFSAHMDNDSVIRREDLSDLNSHGVFLLHFCANHSVSITNTVFEHKTVHMCTWHQDALRHSLRIDFVILSLNLRPCMY